MILQNISEAELINNDNEFENINKSSLNLKIEEQAPGFKDKRYSKQIIIQIIDVLIDVLYKEERGRWGKIDRSQALLAIKLLLLRGAATQSSPPEMGIEIAGGHTLTKQMLIRATNQVTGNSYIRRVAESIAIEIGQHAEQDGLDGELCGSVTKLISEMNLREGYIKHETLTKKERAWCSSFSSAIPDLEKYATPRLKQLLDLDSQRRFAKKNTINETIKTKRK